MSCIFEIEGYAYKGGWIDKPTTEAQLTIEDVLDLFLLKNKRILLIGIGNSSLANRMGFSNFVDGITKNENEYVHSKCFPYRKVYLINKYKPDSLKIIQDRYDIIVDVNPKSYACCVEHFNGYMFNVLHLLRMGGVFLSHRQGLNYASPLCGAYTQEDEEYLKSIKGFRLKYLDNILYIRREE